MIRKGFVPEAWAVEEETLALCYQEPLEVLRELKARGSLCWLLQARAAPVGMR